ncbi:MAG: winged helix-turn-helix transcriptional regulator [Chloroflexi bacterium]|nr:winged helix-turn-helix transcriptional regulator [Chloroflexota bacterium]
MTDVRSDSSYWADYPPTYRAEQAACIAKWLAAGESGVVVGGSGAGKSNLVGFLSSQPAAITSHLDHRPDTSCLLCLDTNSLPALTVPFFYRGLTQALQDAADQWGAEIASAMQQLTQGQVNWDDAFTALAILQKAHHLAIRRAGKKVVWLLDRFDEACRRFDPQTLINLRHLRDRFKGQLCYVVFTRQPLERLRTPGEIDEFYEIVAANSCWVGPMVERDARWLARQMAERLQTTFAEPEVARLIAVTGGLPAFMKAACLALADRAIRPGQSSQSWTQQLLVRPEFQRNCQDIWADLTPQEQQVLQAISVGVDEKMVDAGTIAYLERTGLLARNALDQTINIFSPIFESFVVQHRGTGAGVIELHPKTRAVMRDGMALNIELTPSEDRLLSYFLEHPGEICDKDTLMRAVWPDEQMVIGDSRLAQLVKRLREKIEMDPDQPTYIQTARGRGYRFVQPETPL